MDKLDFPNRITIELTNQCNVSCSFCPRQVVPMQIGFMDMNLYKRIIDEASQHLPIKLVLFFRGESLLHPQFLDCLKYARDKGIKAIQFASNGLAFDQNMAERILDIGIDFISFSLDTLDPKVYQSSRKYGDLHKSMEHVIALSTLCKERKKRGLPVPELQVSTIELDEYMGEQQKFIDFWKKHVNIVRVYYEHDDKGGFRNKNVEKEMPPLAYRMPCRKVFTDMLIYWNGDLALCNYDWNGGLNPININEMSMYDAWHSDCYENIRKMHNENNFNQTTMCNDCQHWRIDYMPEGFLGKMYKEKSDYE